MNKTPIKSGSFTLQVSLCGNYHVAPGAIYIRNKVRAEAVARLYAERMQS